MSIISSPSWSDAEQWINHTLVPHLHQNPTLRLVGLPRLQYTRTLSPLASVFLGNSSVTTHQLLADLHMADWSKKQLVDFSRQHLQNMLRVYLLTPSFFSCWFPWKQKTFLSFVSHSFENKEACHPIKTFILLGTNGEIRDENVLK